MKGSRDVGAHKYGLLDLQFGGQLPFACATDLSVAVGVASVVSVLIIERLGLVELLLQQLLTIRIIVREKEKQQQQQRGESKHAISAIARTAAAAAAAADDVRP